MANILIIGGSRFIGKTILHKLHKEKHKITVINRGTISNDTYLPDDVTHIKVDRNIVNEIRSSVGDMDFDIVFDICAITKDHIKLLLEVIEGKVKRHVHISSGSVYASDNILFLPINEDHPYPELKEDTHPYIRSKTEAEIELYKAYSERDYPMTIVRPTYVYGPNNYVYREAYFFDRISRNRKILLPENGEGCFDMVHVDDLADLTIKLGFANADKVLGEAFNATRSHVMTANMYANQVAKNLGTKADIVYYNKNLLKNIGWPENKIIFPYMTTGVFFMSTEKAYKLLGFEHIYDYSEGLKTAYDWWKNEKNEEPDWKLEDAFIEYIVSIESDDTSLILVAKKILLREINKINE